MPPQTRKLLTLIQQWVSDSGQAREAMRFTRKQLRDAVQWGDTQLKIHWRGWLKWNTCWSTVAG